MNYSSSELELLAYLLILVVIALIIYVSAFISWISKVREKERKLLEAKNQFLNILLMQVKTPLSGILGVIEMLEHGGFGDINLKQKQRLKEIKKAGASVQSTLNDFLQANHNSGILIVRPKAFKIEHIIRDLKELFDEKLKAKNINLVIHLNQAARNLLADKGQIYLVFKIIMASLISKLSKNGQITINDELDLTSGYTITISDSGIKNKDLDTVFADSDYAHGTIEDISPIALVEFLIESHGGSLSFKMDEDNSSSYAITLPKRCLAEKD